MECKRPIFFPLAARAEGMKFAGWLGLWLEGMAFRGGLAIFKGTEAEFQLLSFVV